MAERNDEAWRQTRAVVEALRQLRVEQGLSQKDLGDRLGVVQATVAQFESEFSDPKISTIQRYARALNVSIQFEIEAQLPLWEGLSDGSR